MGGFFGPLDKGSLGCPQFCGFGREKGVDPLATFLP
jgi:hypothetical protein